MKKLKEIFKWIGDNFDLFLISIIVTLSLIFTILDILGLLAEGSNILSYLTLILLSSIAIYLVIERRKNLEASHKEITEYLNTKKITEGETA